MIKRQRYLDIILAIIKEQREAFPQITSHQLEHVVASGAKFGLDKMDDWDPHLYRECMYEILR